MNKDRVVDWPNSLCVGALSFAGGSGGSCFSSCGGANVQVGDPHINIMLPCFAIPQSRMNTSLVADTRLRELEAWVGGRAWIPAPLCVSHPSPHHLPKMDGRQITRRHEPSRGEETPRQSFF